MPEREKDEGEGEVISLINENKPNCNDSGNDDKQNVGDQASTSCALLSQEPAREDKEPDGADSSVDAASGLE
ncbi:hypothetical protein Slin14017_G122140 [Septoria linicola]|nr:hypothetical protein Slin14017_G122140 [Septoria linicola]